MFDKNDRVWINHITDNGRTAGVVKVGGAYSSLVESRAAKESGCFAQRVWYPNTQLNKRK